LQISDEDIDDAFALDLSSESVQVRLAVESLEKMAKRLSERVTPEIGKTGTFAGLRHDSIEVEIDHSLTR
jgi:hypothetical protein